MHTLKGGHFSEIKRVGIIGFFSAFALAAVITIWAVYLESYLHNPSYVGFVTATFMIIGTLTFIFGVPLLEKANKLKLYAILLALFIASYVLFFFISSLAAILVVGIFTTVLGSLRLSLYGIIVGKKTKEKDVSRDEGIIYTLLNAAFFVAPVAAGYCASIFGIKSVFLLGALMFFLSLVLIKTLNLKEVKAPRKIDKHPLKLFVQFFKDKNKRLAYWMGGGIDFWWALIYIFVPIYMYDNGLSDKIIGYFLAAIVLPLILTETKMGKIANKKGFRNLFFWGYLSLGVVAVVCFFISNIYIILAILVLSSFGAAMVEPTTEAYFFDIIKNEKERFYPTYNTVINVSSFFARALSATVLLFLPFKFLFLLFAIAMFSTSLFSTKTRQIIEGKR